MALKEAKGLLLRSIQPIQRLLKTTGLSNK